MSRRRRSPRGEIALQSLAEKAYDCVVLDLRLPGMSGFELIEQIKANPATRRLPVIVYTGRELTRGGQGAPARPRADRDRQGRDHARAPARRDRAVPAPRRGEPARAQAQGAAPAREERSVARGAHGARRRRRRAQHLRADLAARGPQDERAVRRERQARARQARGEPEHRHRADGHHDARDGRLRGHAPDPRAARSGATCR